MWAKRGKGIPKVGDCIYIVLFSHRETGNTIKHLFTKLRKAESFIDTLDETAHATLYRSERLS